MEETLGNLFSENIYTIYKIYITHTLYICIHTYILKSALENKSESDTAICVIMSPFYKSKAWSDSISKEVILIDH